MERNMETITLRKRDRNEKKTSKGSIVSRTSSKFSVLRAIRMLRSTRRKHQKQKKSAANVNPKKVAPSCLADLNEIRNSYSSTKKDLFPGNMSVVLAELRHALVKHDWKTAQELFLYLGKYRYSICLLEPVLWRSALLILLNSPMSSHSHLQEFLEITAGCRPEQLEKTLERFMTLAINPVDLQLNY